MEQNQQNGAIFYWSYRYLHWMEVQSYSKATIINRKTGLLSFSRWCEQRAIITLDALSFDIVRRYQNWLFHTKDDNGRPLSNITQQARLIALRCFCRWLYKQKLLDNITEDLTLPKVKKKLPGLVLRYDEIQAVLGAPDISTPTGLRDRAILEVLYSTGIRRKELTGLKFCDVDFHREILFITQGKGGHQRYVPLGKQALYWIDQYITKVRINIPAHSEALFAGLRNGRKLSVHQLGQIVKKHLNEAGIHRKGSCHLFRHSCATQMLENGADIRYIQQLLGHQDISSTQIYTLVSMAKLKEVHQKFHPAESKKSQTDLLPHPAPCSEPLVS